MSSKSMNKFVNMGFLIIVYVPLGMGDPYINSQVKYKEGYISRKF